VATAELVPVIPSGKSIIHTLDRSGDTKLIWDRSNADEVAAARKMFDDLRAKQFTAYKTTDGGKKGDVITRFDETAERIIMVPRMVGG
jgi:hypothetical protein